MKKTQVLFSILFLLLSFGVSGQLNIYGSGPFYNTNFELTPTGAYTSSSAVAGWTVSSQIRTSCSTSTWAPGSPEFSIVNTPQLFVPLIGILPQSPLGGGKVAAINNFTANGSVTKLSITDTIVAANTFMMFAFAGVWQSGTSHTCCEQAFFRLVLKDSVGNVIPTTCPSFELAGAGCFMVPTYSLTNGTSWTSWQVKYIDLGAYTGKRVTIEVIVGDCSQGDHYGTVFFDAESYVTPPGCSGDVNPGPNVIFCPGASSATIVGPMGFDTYSWTAPSGFPISPASSTLSNLTVTNAVVGNVYTLALTNTMTGCFTSTTYTLSQLSLSIYGVYTTTTCAGGASGTGYVQVYCNLPFEYEYKWLNSNGNVIDSVRYAQNLAAGVYSVLVSAVGAAECGTIVTTVTITPGSSPRIVNILKPFCGNQAFLSAPGGSNYQWYSGQAAISASLGGTSTSYTVQNPVNNSHYWLSYISPYGCHDSVDFHLFVVPSGSITALSIPPICIGATNGTALFNLLPSGGTPLSFTSYSVFSVSSGNNYTAAASSLTNTSVSLSGLSAGNYSIAAFDGSCKYSQTFTVNTLSFNYTTIPITASVCSGNSIVGAFQFSPMPSNSQYTYSWSPNIFLAGNANTFSNTIITPTVALGSQTTIIYTVVATPSVANCPLSKTISITVSNPATPTITAITPLCQGASTLMATGLPSGGNFSSTQSGLITPQGQLNPSAALLGVNNFSYTVGTGTCLASTQGSFLLNALPQLTITGSASICPNQSTTLLATGANTYSWSGIGSIQQVSLSPVNTTIYTVTGTNTLTTCSALKIVTLTVMSSPNLSLTGNFNLCIGSTATFTGTGASTYTWNGSYIGTVFSVSPVANTSYSLAGAAVNGCTASTVFSVDVKAVPDLTITGNTVLCLNQSLQLTASGAVNYNWVNLNPGAVLNIPIPISGIYTVTGTSADNCVSSKTVQVQVFNCTGINEINYNSSVVLYPNPANETLYISGLQQFENANIVISDMLGRQILVKPQVDRSIDLHTFINGNYVLEIRVGEKVVFRSKFLKE